MIARRRLTRSRQGCFQYCVQFPCTHGVVMMRMHTHMHAKLYGNKATARIADQGRHTSPRPHLAVQVDADDMGKSSTVVDISGGGFYLEFEEVWHTCTSLDASAHVYFEYSGHVVLESFPSFRPPRGERSVSTTAASVRLMPRVLYPSTTAAPSRGRRGSGAAATAPYPPLVIPRGNSTLSLSFPPRVVHDANTPRSPTRG